MTLFQHPNGYYGYNFMYKKERHCHTFKGLSKDQVATKEMEHKLALKKNIPFAVAPIVHTWEEAVDDFKKYAEGHYTRPNDCMYIIDAFSKIVKGMNLNDIKLKHIGEYITSRKGIVKASSINRELNTIRKVFSLALDNDLIDKNPCRKLGNLRIKNPPERYLTKDEEVQLLKVCSPTMQAVIKTAILSGLRKNELLNLKWVDINFNEKYLIARETKNNKTREVPLCEPLIEVLNSITKIGEYVFINPITLDKYKDVRSSFDRAVKRSGIPHISFHKLRHTTASRLNESGVDIVTIQEILGHQNINTTRAYTHNSRESKINAMKLLGNYEIKKGNN